MKSKTGRLLSIALSLLVIGCVACAGAIACGARTHVLWNNVSFNLDGDWHDSFYSEDNYDSNEYNSIDEVLGEFSKIEISVDNIDVSVVEGDNYRLQASYLKSNSFDYQVKDGTLVIKQKEKGCWINIGIGKKNGMLLLTVPEGKQFEKARLETGVGETNVTGLSFDQLEIRGGVGQITTKDIISNETIVKVGVGEVDIQGELKGHVTVNGGVGESNIETSLSEKDYNYDISQGVGEISINSKNYDMFQDASQNNGAANNMKIKGGVGQITIKTK